jgi:hypothetical protein
MFKQVVLPLIIAAVLAALLTTAVPQTADNMRLELENRGYSSVSVHGPVGRCNPRSRKFTFRAVSPRKEAVTGEVCGDSFPAFDTVRRQKRDQGAQY